MKLGSNRQAPFSGNNKKRTPLQVCVCQRPRQESNPHLKNRNLTCYPLHHEGRTFIVSLPDDSFHYTSMPSGMQAPFSF